MHHARLAHPPANQQEKHWLHGILFMLNPFFLHAKTFRNGGSNIEAMHMLRAGIEKRNTQFLCVKHAISHTYLGSMYMFPTIRELNFSGDM
jgi:hypothetical protein